MPATRPGRAAFVVFGRHPWPPGLTGYFAQGVEPTSASLVSTSRQIIAAGASSRGAVRFGGPANTSSGRAGASGRLGVEKSLTDRNDKMSKAPRGSRGGTQPSDDPQVGAALRSVYQKAIEEEVPDEMLALLSKLD